MKKEIEAILFASGRPISLKEIQDILNKDTRKNALKENEIELFVRKLMDEYNERDSAIEIIELPEKNYVMQLRAEYASFSHKFAKLEISRSLIKTLGFIAFNQPIKQSEVVKAIGNKAYRHIEALIEFDFIQAEKKGRTKVLKTKKKFSEYFGLPYEPEKIKKYIGALMKDI
ncbi:MAG: SMC-Scp complex subunit ScpB [Candidatus Hydrothermarchaeota archaeon]